MKCPECKKPMKWQEGLLTGSGERDMTVGRYYCSSCNLWSTQTESRGLRKGKKLAHKLKGVHAMDKRITKHSLEVQLGILRAKQHCETCKLPTYPRTEWQDWCRCEDCNCLYCQDKVLAKDDPDFVQLQTEAIIAQIKEVAPQRKEKS